MKGFALKRDIRELKQAIESKSAHPVLDEIERQKMTVSDHLHAVDQSLSALAQAIEAVKAEAQSMPKEVAETALFLAEKIINQEIHVNPAVVLKTVETLAAETAAERDRKLLLNQEDVAFLKSEKAAEFAKIEALPNLTIVADPSVPRGNCRIETPDSIIDGSYFKKLEALWNKIAEGKE